MNTQYLADEITLAKSKAARTLSIVAISLAGAYFLEGIFSVLFAVIPLPIIGALFSMVLSVVEFCLMVSSIVFVIISLVRSCRLVKEITALPDTDEKQEPLSISKLARLLSIIAAGVTGFCIILFSILNIFEFILSFM